MLLLSAKEKYCDDYVAIAHTNTNIDNFTLKIAPSVQMIGPKDMLLDVCLTIQSVVSSKGYIFLAHVA